MSEYQIKAAREYEALGKAYEKLNSENLGTVLPLDLSQDLRQKAIQAAQNDDEIQAVYAITRFHEDAPHVKQPLLIVHTKYKGVVLDENKRLTQILDRFDQATQATKEGIGIQVLPNNNVWVKQIQKLNSPALIVYHSKIN